MEACRFVVRGSNRDHPIAVVGPTDFVLEAAGKISAEEVLADSRFSLYCFDLDNSAAVFVECADPSEIERAPFYYQAQAELAIGTVSMPLETFYRVALQIPDPTEGLVFVHSVGRCGSTLLSKALDTIPEVHSLSEPDDLTQLVLFRVAEKASDEDLRRLILSSVKWRCKPRIGSAPDWVAIKMRSEVTVIADLIGSCFGQSKHLFLYREAVSWMRSVFLNFPADRDVYDPEVSRQMTNSWANIIPLVRSFQREEAQLNAVQIRILAWITCMEAYLRLADMDLPSCAVRFEDFTARPIPVLREMFDFLGISTVDWSAIEEVLSRDSQAGTIFDREERRKQKRELTPALIQDVRTMVSRRPALRAPDVVLPNTLGTADFNPRKGSGS